MFDDTTPRILIQNQSKTVSDSSLSLAIEACQRQISEHFAHFWGWDAELITDSSKPHQMLVVMKDKSDEPGALGYHFKDGMPITYVFAKDSIGEPGGWSGVLSHELVEMVADPSATLGAYGKVRINATTIAASGWIFFEVADPVEAMFYEIDGIQVSNFVLPAWFESNHKKNSTQFDYLNSLSYPFQLAPAGYCDVQVDGHWRTIWGKKANQAKARRRLAVRNLTCR